MKKLFSLLTLALLTMSAWAATVTDVITAADLAATSTNYTDFSGVQINTAVYAGQSAKTTNGGIQLRSKNSNSGIVSTTSGGKLVSVKITVESGTNTIDVYGSNTAYTAATDLYGNNQGTKVGSTAETATITVDGNYEYVGIRSNNGAVYISSIEITWETEGGDTPTPSTQVAAPVFNPADGYHFTGSLPVTVSCETEDASIYLYKVVDGQIDYNTVQYFFETGTFYVTETTTYAAQATKGGCDPSEFTYVTYTLDNDNPDPIVTDYIQFLPGEFNAVTSANFTVDKNGVTIASNGTITADQFRFFKNKDITFTANSTAGNITKIEFYCTESGDAQYGPGCVILKDDQDGNYTYEGKLGTWTGSATSVAFNANTNQMRCTEVRVYVDGEIAASVSAPTFDPADGSTFYTETFDVTINCATPGANIVYTVNNGDMVEAAAPVTVTLTGTSTISAYATLGDAESDVVEATYTQVEAPSGITTLAQANGLDDGNNFTFTGDAVVTYHNGKYLFLRDASGYGLIYYDAAPAENFANGTVLSQNWTAQKTTYKGLVEYQNPANVSASGVTNSALAAVQTIEASQMADMINAYVKIEHVKSISGTTATLADGTTVALYNRFTGVTIPEFTDQDCSITGIVSIYNGALQLYFIESDYNSSVEPPVGGTTFELVTDAANLNDGDKIILVNNEAAKAMGAARTSNFGAVSVEINDNIIVTDSANVITLEAQGDNWALKANEGYLYAASGSANQLKAKAEVDSNAIAAITIDDAASIIFQGSNTRNNLRYNKNSVLFSCYASGQEPVYIYKATSEVPPTIATPVFNPANNTTFNGQLNVTITCETEGAQIYYSLDNVTFQPYTTLTITETCDVYAYAQIGDNKSATAHAKYYKGISVSNIEEANGLNKNDKFFYNGEAIVTYQWKNENNGYYSTWIKDATGSGLIYGKQVPELAQGTVLVDGWDATFTYYNSIPEYTYPNNVQASEDVVTVTPTEYATIDTTNVNEYVMLKGLTLTAQEGDTLNFVTADSLIIRNQFGIEMPAFEEGKTYDVTGIVTIYQHKAEIYAITVTEAEDVPVVIRGDVDDNGTVNLSDVTTLINHLLSKNWTNVPGQFNYENSDCDQNQVVNLSDVTTLINYLLAKSW